MWRIIGLGSSEQWARLFQYPACPLPLPWLGFVRNKSEPVRILRSLSWDISPTRLRKCANLIQFFFWPFRAGFLSVRATMRYGMYVKTRYGIPLHRQVWNQIALTVFENLNSDKYYKLRLFLPERRRHAHLNILGHEMVRLLLRLNRGRNLEQTHDKIVFFRICRQAGLPTIPVLASFEDGKAEEWFTPEKIFPPRDLFLKPRFLSNSIGIEAWNYEPLDRTWNQGATKLGPVALLEYFRERAKLHPFLVQEKMSNGPELRNLSNGALVTLRVVTLRHGPTEFRPLFSFLKMPCGDLPTDAPISGGIYCAVNLEDGTLGRGITSFLLRGQFDRHPDTDHPITGARLEAWPEILALAKRAHAHFSLPSVGWDIAVTGDGPCLVEGNSSWGSEVIQTASDRPFGPEVFARWYLQQIEAQQSASRKT